LFKSFLNHITTKKYFKPQDRILISVSGGLDSMVLLHLMQQTQHHIAVASIDHNTRNGASSSDLQFVKKYCQSHEIPFYDFKIENHNDLKENKQKYFREKRYAFLISLAYDKILTAHHKDDQIETLLIKFLNGKTPLPIAPIHKQIIRPLLPFKKQEIKRYAQENNVSFVEDSSNNETDYFRNFLRLEIIPLLEEKQNSLDQKLISAAFRQNENLRLIESLADQVFKTENAFQRIYIQLDTIAQNDALLLFHKLKKWGFNYSQTQDIKSSLEHTGCLFYTSSHEALVDREKLIITNISKALAPLSFPLEETHLPIVYGMYSFSITSVEEMADIDKGNKNVAYFSKSHFNAPINTGREEVVKMGLRTWKKGDSFQPSGMNGSTQTLKKFFSNNKIDRFQKHQIPLLIFKEKIIWVCGQRTDHKFMSTDGPYWRIILTRNNQ